MHETIQEYFIGARLFLSPQTVHLKPRFGFIKEKMMCLSTVFYSKKKKAELAKLPDMVKCYKVVKVRLEAKCYWPPIYDYDPYEKGWNEVAPRSCCEGYWIAYHAFLSKKDAMKWADSSNSVVQCKTEKKDIVAIGNQEGLSVIVTKRIWIPKPKKPA